MTNKDFDIILQEVAGKFSRFQIIFLILFSWIGTHLFISCQVLISVFIAYKQDYWCANSNSSFIDANSSSPSVCHFMNDSNNNDSVACTEWIFDQSEFQSTIRSQFQLVCDREWMVSLGSTSMMAGFLISNYIFGPISDTYGRMVCGAIASTIGSLGAFGAALVPQYWMYCLMRAVVGFSFGGIILSAVTYGVEICLARFRIYYTMAYMATFGLSGFILVGLAYFIRNHFKIQMICASFGLIFLIILLVIPESPRWLLSKGHKDRAFKASKWIAKVNGKPFTQERFDQLCAEIHHHGLKNESLLKILTYPNLRRVTFVLWWCFAVSAFVYYTLSLGSASLGVNVFLNMSLMYAADLITRIITVYVGIKYGRVPFLVVTYFGSGIFILACGPIFKVPELETLLTVFSLTGRVLINMAFEMIWMYGADIFPTVARSSGMGSASAIGRIGSILSPQLENLTTIWPPLPFIISGIVPIIAAILCWIYFPETSKIPTMDYLHDTESFVKINRKKLFSKECLCFKQPIIDEIFDEEIDENSEMKSLNI